MRVAVLHNAVAAGAPPEDQDTLVQVDVVREALCRLGHQPTIVSCTLDLAAMCSALARLKPDAAFNLVESLDGADSLLYLPPAVLDSLGMPYSGSRAEALFLTTNKLLAKRRLHGAGLPTPDWIEEEHPRPSVASQPPQPPLAAPDSWIIKSVWEHGSAGLEDDALLERPSPGELRRRLDERAARTGRRCFAERYIDGREFVVAMLAGRDGPQVLPPAEIDFSAFPPGKPRVVGYRAKWSEDCFEYQHTPRRFDFDPSDRPLLDRLVRLALECWKLFELRGWARVDFRVDGGGQPWILEVNANPCLSPDAGFAAMLHRASISFDRAIERIMEDAGR